MSTNDPEIPTFDLGHSLPAYEELRSACRLGLFYLEDPRLDHNRIEALADRAREFFSWSATRKMELRMERGGRAWRGYFPIGGELTSGRPDLKEGLYFGQQLHSAHAEVQARTPLHGSNLYPPQEGFASAVEEHMRAMEATGQELLCRIATSLGLEEDIFLKRFTEPPLQLFRIFHYPPAPIAGNSGTLGVGPHSDYGLLTLLWQDDAGGLQVRPRGSDAWVDVPPRRRTLVCNLGDMMERVSGGRCHSITHRVLGVKSDRISMPFFLDPGFHAQLAPLLEISPEDLAWQTERWDGESVHDFGGSYGEYLLRKVSRVFPQLGANVLDGTEESS